MLEKIIRKYYDEIFRYCYHHVSDKVVAEDLCQDTFLSFIEHYGRYQHIGKTKNYLYTIAKNKCKDHYKKKTPLFMAELPEREESRSIEDTVTTKQMVMSLQEEFREAVILRYFQELKYAQIASILDISLSLAKYRVKKGLELLAVMEGGEHEAKRDRKEAAGVAKNM